MPSIRLSFSWPKRVLTAALLTLPLMLAPLALAGDDSKPARTDREGVTEAEVKPTLPPLEQVFEKVIPETLDELKAIQDRVKVVLQKVMPAVVAVRIGAGQGSGVIISEDGYVLTAAHVSGPAGRAVVIVLPDGRKVKGETLGANKEVDAGLIKITSAGPWPHVEMGVSADLDRGDWCLAIGHPGGFQSGRSPVVRLGRVLDNLKTLIRSDCTLVGGDSGGPLFDMDGKVVGIHSRIGPSIIYNIHVPVDHFRSDWDLLVKGEVFPNDQNTYLGVQGDREAGAKGCRIEVTPGSPAEKAGLQVDDVITRFGGKEVGTFEDLVNLVTRQKPGRQVDLEVVRNGTTLTVPVTLGKRP